MFYAHDTIALYGFRVVFSREREDRTIELATDSQMPKTGHYQVRLLPGKTYQATLMMGDCRVETQEYWVSAAPADSIQLKSFHLNYPDSTDYGGCLAGWRPYR